MDQAFCNLEEDLIIEAETHDSPVVCALLDWHFVEAAQLTILIKNRRYVEKHLDHGLTYLRWVVLNDVQDMVELLIGALRHSAYCVSEHFNGRI